MHTHFNYDKKFMCINISPDVLCVWYIRCWKYICIHHSYQALKANRLLNDIDRGCCTRKLRKNMCIIDENLVILSTRNRGRWKHDRKLNSNIWNRWCFVSNHNFFLCRCIPVFSMNSQITRWFKQKRYSYQTLIECPVL